MVGVCTRFAPRPRMCIRLLGAAGAFAVAAGLLSGPVADDPNAPGRTADPERKPGKATAHTFEVDPGELALAGTRRRLVPRGFGPARGRPFPPGGPFNAEIGPNVRVDPRSGAMVQVLAGRGYATAQVYADTPPVYNAFASTRRIRVNCTRDDWGTCDLERMRVPVPRGARPSPGYDGNMVVIDWSTGRSYEFWQYRPRRRTASWGAVLPLTGPGTGNGSWDPGRYGAVGSGISRLAGVVRVHEVRRGRIPHALVGPTGFSCRSAMRYPAVKTDGWSTDAGCIPEGARIQLDPRVNCVGLPRIRDWEIPVCRALKIYGWYNIDNGNVGVPGFGIQFENPAGGRDPYAARGIDDYTPIRSIPLNRLRVLRTWRSHD
jgi:hypothetical protein